MVQIILFFIRFIFTILVDWWTKFEDGSQKGNTTTQACVQVYGCTGVRMYGCTGVRASEMVICI